MALDANVAQKIIKSVLESSPNPASAINMLRDCGVTIGEITQLALDHAPLKTRLNDIGTAVNAAGGKWPLPLPEPVPAPKAAAASAGTTSGPVASKEEPPK